MNRPRRFAVAAPPGADNIAIVTGDELHHMRGVTRLPQGARVELIDSAGVEYTGEIVSYKRDRAAVRVESKVMRNQPRIILAAAIIKGPRMDFVVEKAAELGASELWPVVSDRGLVRGPGEERLARWRRLALAASKQSRAGSMMVIRAPLAFDDLIRGVPADTLAIVCAIGARPLGDLINESQPRALLLTCGPEGDFTRAELEAAASAGFAAAGLGPNRLRSETAALAAMSIAAERMHRGA